MSNRCVLFHCPGQCIQIVAAGLWGLADCLDRNGFPTQIVHVGLEESLTGEFHPGEYVDDEVVLCGFSVQWFKQLKQTLRTARLVKEYQPETFVVLGGYTASYYCQTIMNDYPWVDGVIRGDGEVPLTALARALSSGVRNLEDIPNLVWRDGDQLRENAFSYVAEPEDVAGLTYGNYSRYLSNYPFVGSEYMRRTSLPHTFYGITVPTDKTFYLTVGRGCPVECSFCGGARSAQKLINNRTACLHFPDDVALNAVRQAVAHGYQNIYFCFDPVPPKPQFLSLLRRMQEEQLDVGLTLGMWALPTPDTIAEMKRTSDRLMVEVSPETADEGLRRRHRGFYFSNAQLDESVKQLFDARIYTQVYFGYFLGGDTDETVAASRRMVWEFNARYPSHIEAGYIRYSTDPGSGFEREPERYGVELTFGSLEQFMEYAETAQGNAMAYTPTSLSPERQAHWESVILRDMAILHFFRDLCRLLIRGIGSVDAFIAFLDRFYAQEEMDLTKTSPAWWMRMAGKLVDFAEANHAGSLAIDVLRFSHALAAAWADMQSPSLPPGGVAARAWVRRAQGFVAVALQHDLPTARKVMATESRYPDLEQKPVYILLRGLTLNQEVARLEPLEYALFSNCTREALPIDRVIGDSLRQVGQAETEAARESAQQAIARMMSHGWIEMGGMPK